MFTLVDLGLYPTMFCEYLAHFWPAMDADHGDFWLRKGVMVAVIWTFILLNMAGARTVGGFTKLFAVLVLSPFVLMAVFGVAHAVQYGGFPNSPMQPFAHPTLPLSVSLAVALPIVLWNFQGWDAISTIAGEMNDPRRDYPRALGISAVVITLTYWVPAFFGMAFVNPADIEWKTGSWNIAAERIAGPWLASWVSAMGMVSAIGLFASLVLCYSRIPFVMAFDGYLPRSLTLCNANGAPTVALLVCGVLYTIVVLTFRNFEELAEVDVTMFAAVMVMELASFLALRWREPTLPRPFRVPGGWIVALVICALPVACVSFSLYSSVSETENGLWRVVGKALVLMATGPLLYPLLAWRKRRMAKMPTGAE
jgi:amino acid transporter